MTAVDPTEIAAHLREVGNEHGYEFDTILVFGSYATGDATAGSDVDIVAVSSEFSDIEYYARAEDFHFGWDTDRYPRPDLILLTPEEFEQRRNSPGDVVAIADEAGIRF